jgi:KDO2-lipid IV(A) lauroyltransferase
MQLAAYILLYPILWCISILPFRLLYVVSDILYVFIYKIFGYRKQVVYDNLTLVFSEKSEDEKKKIMTKFYHHLCDMMVEAIKSITISEKTMKKHFVFANIDLINKLEAQNRSIILMCSHYGSWEWIFIMQSFVDKNSKGYAVYKPLANKYFDKLFKGVRAKYNSTLISTKETIPTLLQASRNGDLTISGFVSDQSPKTSKATYWAEFMGIKVPVHTGAEAIATKLNMAVVFFGVERLKRGYYKCTYKTITEQPKTLEKHTITDEFIKLAEQQIYDAPEYYLWTHKRWKHRGTEPAIIEREIK